MSRILENVHRSAKRLHAAGHMTDLTMREFDALCLPKTVQAFLRNPANLLLRPAKGCDATMLSFRDLKDSRRGGTRPVRSAWNGKR
jgi:hypothetical protein